jgi:glutathione S-transferase
MMKLFYAPGTCALAPHIVLEWIGEPYELEKVKLGSSEYLKINPLLPSHSKITYNNEQGVLL